MPMMWNSKIKEAEFSEFQKKCKINEKNNIKLTVAHKPLKSVQIRGLGRCFVQVLGIHKKNHLTIGRARKKKC